MSPETRAARLELIRMVHNWRGHSDSVAPLLLQCTPCTLDNYEEAAVGPDEEDD